MTRQIGKKSGLAMSLALIIFSLLLSACGYTPQNATATSQARSNEAATISAVQTSVAYRNTSTTLPSLSRTTPPSANTTPPTTSSNSSTTAPAANATPTPIVGSTLPTPSAPGEKIDKEAELKLVKIAYDAILKNLFKEPDTTGLLKAALDELSRTSGVTAPTVNFSQKDNEANWVFFRDAYNKTLDAAIAKGFKYPKNQLGRRIVDAMAQSVSDEHTYFLDPDSYDNRLRVLQGENSSVGFGIATTTQDNKIYIVRVVPGSPAEKAGLREGDQLVRYDETTLTDANRQITRSAKENETHNFTIARPGLNDLQTITVTKKRYNVPTVETRLINGHIGYIAIREFFADVADKTNKAMTDLAKQGADSWIIDVRNNPGGVNVEQLTGRFVKAGEVMGYNLDRKGRETVKVSGDGVSGEFRGKPFNPRLPLVLLINDGSGSSSEIFALAVRDFNLGSIIGEKTAGALGHTAAFALGDGSAISVTVDEYESKSGARANGTGVSPDVQVSRSINDLINGRDPQMDVAVNQLEKTLAKK